MKGDKNLVTEVDKESERLIITPRNDAQKLAGTDGELLGNTCTEVYNVIMETADTYSIGFFVTGSYRLLCREGSGYRFRVINPHGDLEPAEFGYVEARNFIETHPICANISRHDIRIMHNNEVRNILQGKSPESKVKSLSISSEEEEEEPLH